MSRKSQHSRRGTRTPNSACVGVTGAVAHVIMPADCTLNPTLLHPKLGSEDPDARNRVNRVPTWQP